MFFGIVYVREILRMMTEIDVSYGLIRMWSGGIKKENLLIIKNG